MMINAVKTDRIVQLMLVLCCFVLAFILAIYGAVGYKWMVSRQSTSLDRAKAILEANHFTFGEPVPDKAAGKTSLPIFGPEGQKGGIRYDDTGAIVEVGLMMVHGKENESIDDIVTLTSLVAPGWDSEQWVKEAIANKKGKTIVNGYKFEIIIFGLSLFAGSKE
jgi:hypothetical protein